jgi:uncharacterized protein YneR
MPSTATVTINDNEIAMPGTLAFSSATYSGMENSMATITVNRTSGSDGAVTVNYATSSGSATGGASCTTGVDYVTTSGMLSFANGETTKTFNVNLCSDAETDPNETVNLAISNATGGATIGAINMAVLTISEPPVSGSLQFSSATYSVGEAGPMATLTVSRTVGSAGAVTINYTLANGSATGGATCGTGVDYVNTGGMVSFADGEMSKTFNVTICEDMVFEGNETFTSTLSNPTGGATLGMPSTATVTINDNEIAMPGTLTLSAPTYMVGESGGTATITVNRTSGTDGAVTVSYILTNTTATGGATCAAGIDYVNAGGMVSFANGEGSKTFTIPICPDTLDEANETFNVILTNPTGGAVLGSPSSSVVTITDDDPSPTISINDVSQAEGNSGTTNFTFTVTLSTISGQSVTVDYATADGTATVANTDYSAIPITTLTFAPGETTKMFSVTVNGDTTIEDNETFFVNLTAPTNATISDNQGQGTIQNDDFPSLSINDISLVEGNSGTTAFGFTVTLSQASPQSVSVNYATANGTATVADNDYVAIPSTALTFAPGDLTKTINVTVNGDTSVEANETFFVNLTMPTNATIADNQGQGTIQNDDIPTISINDVSMAEGDSGTTAFGFTVTLSQASPQSVSVNYATANGTATVADNDYVAIPSTTLTFAPGETTKPINVLVNGDGTVENNETFFVNLTMPTNATISDNQGQGTIINDDIPSLSIGNVTQIEGNSGTSNFIFNVTLSKISNQTVSVNYATADNTATAPSDYNGAGGTLTFSPGTLSRTISIVVRGDTLTELNETFFINLSVPINATIFDGQAVGTILNDDSQSLRVNDVRLFEGNAGNTIATFTVNLTQNASRPEGGGAIVTVDYQTVDFTARANLDYRPISGSLTFNPGETQKTLQVTIFGDTIKEANEIFSLDLFNPINAGITQDRAFGIIVDEDRAYNSDYDRDRLSDYTVYRPDTSFWYTFQSTNNIPRITPLGQQGDIPVPGDYDGDLITDLAVYRPSTGDWFILQSQGQILLTVNWGTSQDKPVQGDYDGDGKTDVGVFRPSDGRWYVIQSTNGVRTIKQFGAGTDTPVTGDFDGDFKNDLAVFRNGVWFIFRSSDSGITIANWGTTGDRPVSGDFDGDGKTDLAIFRAGTWWIFYSLRGTFSAVNWGLPSDIPAPADYDGDGTSDVAVFRPSEGNWYVLRSSNNSFTVIKWGTAGDIPIPSAYTPQQ